MIILGIDLGVHGAIAVLEGAAIIQVHDMPCLNDGPAGRRTVNAPLLAEIIATSHAAKVYVESVSARPTDGHVGAFAFGRARGVVEGVCAGLAIPVEFITAPRWKKIIGIAPGKDGAKDAARSQAIRRWPGNADLFRLAKHDGRAESCLIAIAGMSLGQTSAGA
jgi:crossover junction endodeoxyribonuclease RuvC